MTLSNANILKSSLDCETCGCSPLLVAVPCDVMKDCNTIIHEKYAKAAFDKFNTDRYGLKDCTKNHDVYFLQDMLELKLVSDELADCELELDCECSCKIINERIKTL
jgi:hypothetical protein